MDELNREDYNIGIVKISDEVISVIAAIAASEIKGVVGMNPGLTGGITQLLTGKKNSTKGVKVTVEEESTSIEMALGVDYGIKIPEVVGLVQENVRKTVEAMTGLKVSSVNIFVQHIVVQKTAANIDK
ncbi:Asp23/Gls24 family envelope stress response protein [Clostridium hydrogeniformans]|uniref:Asp23/Gls24 family envelope stress response protein n=1 Tax=Clostridium hydrogeniformans TaxID=349933 RepID=UPI0004848845|nr:Asp23/Gls24 family envelope stress response protein [Clostridium hydrogeniformans]